MGDAGARRPYGLEFLRLPQLLLALAQGLLGGLRANRVWASPSSRSIAGASRARLRFII